MTDTDRVAFAEMLALMGEAFNEPVSEARAEAYFAVLKPFTFDEVRRAGFRALEIDNFFPRPARLRELIVGTTAQQADAAWAELLGEVRRVGSWGKPLLTDATWEAMKQLWGSWGHLCATLPADGPELLGWAKQFKAAYHAKLERAASPLLPGFTPQGAALTDGRE